jgi:hypothetical protein
MTTNVEKYLGRSKLTADYKGDFFDEENVKYLKLKVKKILKSSNDEIIFVTSEKYYKRVFVIRTLRRLDENPQVVKWENVSFPALADAIAYYEK